MNEDTSKGFPLDHAPGVHALLEPEKEPQKESMAQLFFEIFCALIFLGMIGLVFYNALLRYLFSSSYPPSEEWARFLFMRGHGVPRQSALFGEAMLETTVVVIGGGATGIGTLRDLCMRNSPHEPVPDLIFRSHFQLPSC